MTHTLLFEEVLPYFFVFARLGVMLMLMPGFGEVYIPPRIRLMFGFVLTLIIAPVVDVSLPPMSLFSTQTVVYLVQESLIGLFLGSLSRIFLNALQVTATVIGLHTSLSSAVMFNPALGTQDSVFSSLFIMGATAMIFVTNTHHLIIETLVNSYDTFPPLERLPLKEMNDHMIDTASQSFVLGVKLAFPVMIVSTVLTLSTGLLSRLMPQLQVYFMVMPLQILLGFMTILMTLSLLFTTFIDEFVDFLRR